ncbi:MAG TPA: type II toxin-antitoxin system RelE/ParE family toxin [Cryomorphaceae bacterium]|nr:type II toxin-antitoxin system RelE/ParE family toxin [Cryomorphaceae bacterium]
MKVEIDKSFKKDLKKLKNSSLNKKVAELIETLTGLDSPKEISDIKKLKGEKHLYRIRIGEYRLGLEILEDRLTLIRCLHRKDIYKHFPK